jgi:hypothetical protein
LKFYFLENATRRSGDELSRELLHLPFEAFAPIRVQLLCILRAVNEVRSAAGFDPLPRSSLNLIRHPLRVFE